MLLHSSFVTLIFALSAFGASIKRDAAQVTKDFETLDEQTKLLDTSIKYFPQSGGNLMQAMAIHEAAINLDNAVRSASADTNASPAFSDAEASTIIGQAEILTSDVKKALDDLVNKRSAIAALGISEVVENDIALLETDAKNFGTELLDKTPAPKAGTIQELFSSTENAFQAAKQAFSQVG